MSKPVASVLLSMFFFVTNTFAQRSKQSLEYTITSGYHIVTPGPVAKGFFIQSSIAYQPEPIVTLSFSANLAKASNYPKGKFEAPVSEFVVWRDTIGYEPSILYNLLKDKSLTEVMKFRLTQVTNLYLSLNADVNIINNRNYNFSTGFGLNLIYTMSNDLVLGEVNFSGGRLYSYKPLIVVNKELLYGLNLHIRFNRRIFKEYYAGIFAERIYDNLRKNAGRYNKAEAVNIGLSLSKRFTLNKKP
jgi:hypothetical protein